MVFVRKETWLRSICPAHDVQLPRARRAYEAFRSHTGSAEALALNFEGFEQRACASAVLLSYASLQEHPLLASVSSVGLSLSMFEAHVFEHALRHVRPQQRHGPAGQRQPIIQAAYSRNLSVALGAQSCGIIFILHGLIERSVPLEAAGWLLLAAGMCVANRCFARAALNAQLATRPARTRPQIFDAHHDPAMFLMPRRRAHVLPVIMAIGVLGAFGAQRPVSVRAVVGMWMLCAAHAVESGARFLTQREPWSWEDMVVAWLRPAAMPTLTTVGCMASLQISNSLRADYVRLSAWLVLLLYTHARVRYESLQEPDFDDMANL